ncbi:MAG: hypothetical protein IJ622_03030 [Bacteroidales bacterium]|nr:hypothetical protein [Bacteroidales bacterium]
MKRYILIIGALLAGFALKAQEATCTCRYWFDENHAQAVTTTFGESGWEAELDVGNLTDGLHALHLHVLVENAESRFGLIGDSLYQLADTTLMKWSTPQTFLFLKTDQWEQGMPSYVYHCWFDQDFEHQQSDALGMGYLLLDVADLEEGLHTVHVMLEGSSLTSAESFMFMKVAPFEAEGIDMSHLAYHCWFDQDFEHQVSDSLRDGHILLDVNDLEEGLHSVHVMLEGSTLTATQSYMFLKMAVQDFTAELQYHCWFDQDYDHVQTGLVGSGLVELEVGDLPNGLHIVNVQLDNGSLTAPQTYLFYKIPLGGYGLARWEYWINDDWDNRNITTLSPSLDTLDILSLLPVGHPSIRSSCYHFHPNGDNPYINAKNQITFRFWDTEMRFFDKTAFYVDEHVQQEIVAQVFERNTTETFAAPRDNQITWYKLDAVVGDSLSFKANKACTMQLFAPSGEEVFNVSGPESIVLGGLHAWEEGTYYLAVHDMTGSGETVSVTYNWIGKYCVLALTPDKVGNRMGNRFSVDLIGNGFNYMENAMLVCELDTIVLSQVVIPSRTRPRFQFLINNPVANGKYDLFLTFIDGDETESLVYHQAVELEEPNPGEKIVSITTPQRTANPYPVRVTVENTGNMDYVYVPFNIAFTWPTNSYSSDAYFDQIDFADFSATMSLEADSVNYSFAHVTTNLLDMGKEGGIMFFWISYLKAHETRSFTLNFTAPAHIRFDLYAWMGEGYEYNLDFDTLVANCGNRANYENMVTVGNVAQLSGNVAQWMSSGGGLPNPVNAAGSLANTSVKLGLTLGGIQNGLGHIQDKAVCDAYGITPDNPLYEDIMALHPPLVAPGIIRRGWVGEIFARLFGLQQTCGDLPTPNPGTPCHVFLCHPGDPNDIHGYLSESGSHYMRQEIQNVQYEIEFENDTTMATAAAHTIIVRDTLDATKFDLNSLAARSASIGDKRLELNGEQQFAYTLDLRPEIYVIAQVEQVYDPTTGIIQWTIQSLDPMTMEPTDDPNQGVLPVNYFGNGIGSVDYSIDLKEAFADGTEISNRAGIIFDQEDIIMTPTWTNIIDAVKPTSHIESVEMVNDSLAFSFVSDDNRSGVWYHTLYYRNDSTQMEWQVRKPQIIGNEFMLQPEWQTTEYLVIAVDSAGNREEKEMVAEYIYYYDGPEPVTQCDDLSQGWNWWAPLVHTMVPNIQAALDGYLLQIQAQSGTPSGAVVPGEMYKLLTNSDCSLSITGAPITAATVEITQGTNWFGYIGTAKSVGEVFNADFGPAEGDKVISQDGGFAIYNGEEWQGTLETLQPGHGYVYYSASSEPKTLVMGE